MKKKEEVPIGELDCRPRNLKQRCLSGVLDEAIVETPLSWIYPPIFYFLMSFRIKYNDKFANIPNWSASAIKTSSL